MNAEINTIVDELINKCRSNGLNYVIEVEDKEGKVCNAYGVTPASSLNDLVDFITERFTENA